MEARRKVKAAMDRHYREADRVRVAGQLPPALQENADAAAKDSGSGFGAVSGSSVKRAIPEGYSYDPAAIKPLAQVLWAMSVSLGHAMTAHRQLTRLKSAQFSPDGMMGGRGYVMPIKEMRKELYNACEALSAISDTVFDEINAPHWKPKLGQLERDDLEDIGQLVGDAERILEDPEGEAEEDMEEAEEGKGKTKGAPWTHPAARKKNEEAPGQSGLPEGGDQETSPDHGKGESDPGQPTNRVKQASIEDLAVQLEHDLSGAKDWHDRVVDRVMASAQGIPFVYAYSRGRHANSSVPVQYLPGGPRVDHIGPAEGQDYGAYNDPEPSLPEGDEGTYVQPEPGPKYNYPSAWENEFEKSAEDVLGSSAVPDAVTEGTPTEGFDFGVGRGDGNNADGQGQNHLPVDPDDGGVWGPHAEMPGDLGGATRDTESDSNPTVEQQVGPGGRGPRRQAATGVAAALARAVAARFKAACEGGCTGNCQGSCDCKSKLPNDGERPVARSDYSESTTLAQSDLPGDGSDAPYEFDPSLPGTGYRYERSNTPYIKWDYTTHQMRPDPIHQRSDEGPYVNSAAETEPSNG